MHAPDAYKSNRNFVKYLPHQNPTLHLNLIFSYLKIFVAGGAEIKGVEEPSEKSREIVLGRNVHTTCHSITEPEVNDEQTGDKEAQMVGVLARYRKSLMERIKHHLGDSFIESNYGVHSRQFEVGVLDWREVFPDGILYASQESHYSVFKATRMNRMECVKVDTLISGEIDCDDLRVKLSANKDKPTILNVNIGTTVKGAIDDLDRLIQTLEECGFSHDRFYIHCDGAFLDS
ncbi:hypothetical protein V6N13_129922 [Hibiscus sabdariffa]